MPDSRGLPAAAAPVAEIERKVQWRVVAMLAFIGIMLALAAVAIYSMVAPPPRLAGLPDDPDVAAAIDVVRGKLQVEAGGLRFDSALLGPATGAPRPPATVVVPLLKRAQALLERAADRHPRDPRLGAALACLDLVRRDPGRAASGYRAVLERPGRYGEARLGLGVALALAAERAHDALEQRSLRLQALAQFAAVDRDDPAYAAALFDRALLLQAVGRDEEARSTAAEYLARDSTGIWAERLRESMGAAGVP